MATNQAQTCKTLVTTKHIVIMFLHKTFIISNELIRREKEILFWKKKSKKIQRNSKILEEIIQVDKEMLEKFRKPSTRST